MLYKTHIAGGLVLGYISFTRVPMLKADISQSKVLIIIISGLILGSLFPDIDHKNSYLSRKIRPLSYITSKIFKHREFTHSIAGVFSISYILYLILGKTNMEPIYLGIFNNAFTIGMISHIILDMMTVSGVALFYPLNRRRISFGLLHPRKYYKIESKQMIIMIAFIIIALISYVDF